jgi:uncharacterized ion transporter superfamily protein YfcC
MSAAAAPRRRFAFPSPVTTLAIVTVLVWVAALFLPSGVYLLDASGSPIPGTYQTVPSPLTFGQMIEQLVLSPINGLYGIRDAATGFVSTSAAGHLFGSVGVVVFIMAIGAFMSVSYATHSLEVAIGALAVRLRDRGGLLIAAIMVLFSALGSTMGFSVETLGFYALFIPLMAALGYDRMVTASMIIVGALVGVMAATVNPFSIGVASGEAGVSIGDGIGLRLVLWVVLTGISVAYVLRYAARVRARPETSLVSPEVSDGPDATADEAGDPATRPAADEVGDPATRPAADDVARGLTRTQRWVLAIMAFAFGLMIFSVIPWSSLVGGTPGPAEDYYDHVTAAAPYWFELNWWFPELAMLFIIASAVVGMVARMGERETVRLIGRGAADMINPAMVVLLAQGVAVIMTNTLTLGTILHSMEQLVTGTSAGFFAVLTEVINIPLAVLIPSSSGHATLAMPLLAPLSDFAGVDRPLTITAWIMGHGLTLLFSPTSVVLVAGLAIAKVGYDRYLRFAWPLLLMLFAVSAAFLAVVATFR